MRLRKWAKSEAESRAELMALTEAARRRYEKQVGELWRGRDLKRVLKWWKKEQPTAAWVGLCTGGDGAYQWKLAQKFLTASKWRRRRWLLWWAMMMLYVGALQQLYLPEARFRSSYKDVWLMLMVPSVLTVEQEKEKTAMPGSDFKECEYRCPVMIVVPAGKFLMGSPESESDQYSSEGPQREVTIAKPFAVSKFEVTFAEWDACVVACACPKVEDSSGRGQMPVINVSWDDATQYVGWLSQSTGKEYRLLSEAEWEYAARAGTATRYSWGDKPSAGNANCNSCGSQWDRKQTAPVGSFEANAFGLYDMHGNVSEWVEDTWHSNYGGAPLDGSAWVEGGHQGLRVVRGGSWNDDPQYLRAASRLRNSTDFRSDSLGFRLARTLNP